MIIIKQSQSVKKYEYNPMPCIPKNHTVGELKKQLTLLLQKMDITSAQQHSRWLLEALLNRPYTEIITQLNQPLTAIQQQQITQWLRDYQQHKPIAYILQKTDFMGLTFQVTEDVLIPRNDSETMVEYTLSLLQEKAQHPRYRTQPLRLIELGIGSGAIIISLSRLAQLPKHVTMELIGTDKSAKALKIAKINAKTHQAYIDFMESDWFSDIKTNKPFDIIISNPPYVDKEELLPPSLTYEPDIALYAEENGMSEIKKIIGSFRPYLHTDGALIMEHGSMQGKSVRELLLTQNNHPKLTALTYQDRGHRDRFTVVKS